MKHKNIIFVHGWASGPYVWLHQASYFNNKCRVHTPELINDGSNIRDFIVNNGLDDICLVGWSLGGIVSMKLAAQLKTRVRRLVLIGAPQSFTQKEVMKKIYNRMQSDFQGTLDWFYKFCFSSNERSRNEFGEVIKLLGDIITPLDKEMLLAGLTLLMNIDSGDALKDICAPVLIIQGGQDKICLPEAGKFLAKAIKGARIEVLETAGHAPFLTDPQNVNALIEDFIRNDSNR